MTTDDDPPAIDLLANLLEASGTALAAETLTLGPLAVLDVTRTFAWRGMGGARTFTDPDA